jgi:hypothetical protein
VEGLEGNVIRGASRMIRGCTEAANEEPPILYVEVLLYGCLLGVVHTCRLCVEVLCGLVSGY